MLKSSKKLGEGKRLSNGKNSSKWKAAVGVLL